jgi:hypothetical protein
MTKRAGSIAALLKRCEEELRGLEAKYTEALKQQSIPPNLKIDIKNLVANLRSALDYIAADIRETCCPTADPEGRFYFPILPSESEFAGQARAWFPGLEAVRPDVGEYLRSVQPHHAKFKWLSHLNAVNNEHKHIDLVEQTRVDSPRVTVTLSRGGGVSWNPGAVKFGPGVFIGGVPVNPATQLPVPDPSQRVERVTWVDFRFSNPNISVLGLLKEALAGTERITREIKTLLDKPA